MNKNDIIQRVAYATVPEGTTLREQTTPQGLTVSHFGAGETEGFEIIMAQVFEQGLESWASDMPDEPDSALMRKLHEACVASASHQINATVFEAVENIIVDEHRQRIACLKNIATELEIYYDPPEDPYLE